MFVGMGPGTGAFTDLLCSKPASTNAATPARSCFLHASGHWFLIGAPGSHQFATAMWTLSLNHKLRRRNVSPVWKISWQGGWCEPPQP